MTRWLVTLVLGTSLLAGPAGAQVFKPKSGSSGTSSSTASKSSGKTSATSAKKSSSKKTARKSKKKSSAASKGRPSDLTPEDAPKVDPDYVKIIDDDE